MRVSDEHDGENMAVYKGHEKWSRRRWAWEFLRRNEKFQEDCDRANLDDPEAIDAIAKEFGLRKFKNYRESFSIGDKPTFSVSVRMYQSQENVDRRLRLESSEVLLRFNLSYATKNNKFLKGQLTQTRGLLKKAIQVVIDRQEERPLNKKLVVNPAEYLKRLRVLDAVRFKNKSHSVIFQLLYPKESRGADNIQNAKALRSRRDTALELTRNSLAIAACSYEPN